MSSRALRAACEVAESQGLRFDRPRVLRDATNLLIELAPAGVVARVATTTAVIRRGDGFLAREVRVASRLAARGAPVIAPASTLAPGPHTHDGFVLTFWTLERELDELVDPEAAGRALATCHEMLEDIAPDLELPAWQPLDEATAIVAYLRSRQVLDETDLTFLEACLGRARERIEANASPPRPLHGDAHLGNVSNTARGALWNDWEDTFSGALGWDLACLLARGKLRPEIATAPRAAAAAHGARIEATELESMIELRIVYVTLWAAIVAAARGASLESVQARLTWLRHSARA